ncbi:GNAT family N-acetyltransferase [Bacillus sp. FJAT-27986]|uniref:GNAT family N-acetyltransferase n=1 Tax=unclassified Bacillus (in: firmicutes) TaxID=185979 RepID=UPI00098143D5
MYFTDVINNKRWERVIVPGCSNDFYIAIGGNIVAQIEFVADEQEVSEQGSIIINHTLVANSYRGKGLGKALVNRVVLHARNENKYIKPVCPFAKMMLENKKEYQDVLM